MTTALRGIAWNHPHGPSALLATADDVLGVRIGWSARLLQVFGDQPIGCWPIALT